VEYCRFAAMKLALYEPLGDRVLSEINPAATNIAYRKPTTQSSLYRWSSHAGSSRAVDGTDHKRFAFHTEREANPWWVVDLEACYPIMSIRIQNRKDKEQDRARSLCVQVSSDLVDWTDIHRGTMYWGPIVEFPLGGKVDARFVRISLDEFEYLHLAQVEVYVERKTVIAARGDGLGERLNAILNGLWLAEAFNTDFRFTWNAGIAGAAKLSEHAIIPAEDFFADSFIQRYMIDSFDGSKYPELSGANLTAGQARQHLSTVKGWRAPRVALKEIFGVGDNDATRFSLQEAFDRIEFHPDIRQAIESARAVDLSEGTVGFHLRSGDVFYGPYRKWVHYTYKGITLPVAKAMVAEALKLDKGVLIFGQDKEVIRYLCAEYGVLSIDQIQTVKFKSEAAQAMYELVLMSRCQSIYAGSSGFAKQASWISGTKLMKPTEVLAGQDTTRISLDDLAVNATKYHPLQTAFAYWFAYFYGRKNRTLAEASPILRAAMSFDADNELYPIVLAAHYFEVGQDAEAETLLTALIERDADGIEQGVPAALEVFVSKTGRDFNLSEYMAPYSEAASRQCPGAQIFHAWSLIASGSLREAFDILDRACAGSSASEAHVRLINWIRTRHPEFTPNI
jgi:hypothetical protein